MTQTTQSPDHAAASPSQPDQLPPESPIKVKRLSFTKTSPSPEPSPEASADAGLADPVAQPESSALPRGAKSPRTGSSQGSSLVDLKVISEGIEGTVIAITGQLHELLARDAYDQWAQVYLADSQDAQGIAAPAAKILNRHTGEITGGNPDVADGIMIGIAAAFYVVKQLGKFLSAKRARRAGADLPQADNVPTMPADDPAYAPA